MKNTTQDIFKKLGLGAKEASIFDVLLKHSNLKATDISQKTGINRSTVYAVLKTLRGKGLVSMTTQHGSTVFHAIDPHLLPSYIERKQEDLEEIKGLLSDIAPFLAAARATEDNAPKVTYFSGKEGVKQAYEDTLINNTKKEIYVFSGPDVVFEEMGSDYVEYYVHKRTRLGIKSFQIAPATPWGSYIQEQDGGVLRETMLIPEQFAFDTEMVMYDNKLGIFSFKKGMLLAVIIEDDLICNTLLALFKYIQSVQEKKQSS